MNSVEHTALLLEQYGIQIRLVDGFSLEIRMHGLSLFGVGEWVGGVVLVG